METKKASNKALKHILCCVIILIAFVITFISANARGDNQENTLPEVEDIVPLRPQLSEKLLELKVNISENNVDNIVYNRPRIIKKDADYYINNNINTLKFFSEAFGYELEAITENIKQRNIDILEIEETNIASLKDEEGNIKIFPNTEYGIVEYFYELNKDNLLERKRKLVPYEGNSEYVEKLIMYYTTIYTNVDRTTALSIGAAESGYYQVKYMLRYNNVYGGMSKNGLIRHDNIELGVLEYIRLLSNNYFGKGLTTVSEIGYVYCPTLNDNGIKVPSSHWINLVTKAQGKYETYTEDITLESIMN